MDRSPKTDLVELERLKTVYDEDSRSRKAELIRTLARRRLRRAEEVLRLHEALCFLRAYPDDARVLDLVTDALARFGERGDLRRCRGELESTGVAGTRTRFRFFWPTARWLMRRWPEGIRIDWPEFDNGEHVTAILSNLLPYCETPALDELEFSPREWLDQLRGPDETDAAFLIRRFEGLRADESGREKLYDTLDVPLILEPAKGTPARSTEGYAGSPVTFQTRPLRRARPDLRRDVLRPPAGVQDLSRREGNRLIDLARSAMVTRARDLDAFANADPNDVRLVDCGDGLVFACYGALPERRLMLESSYGFLTLKNGVPIGYVLASALFGSAAIAYNVFETYRGGEAGYVFGRVLAMVRHLFGVDSFSIDPYQLGHGNAEGLGTGAWWFYYKLGFRPVDPDVLAVLRGELRRMKADPRHRSSRATLKKLVVDDVYWHRGRERSDVLGQVSLGNIGLRVSAYLAEHFGAEREQGMRACVREASRRLGARSTVRWSRSEKLWFERWSPLLLSIPRLEAWTTEQKRAAVAVVRGKGGRHESSFVPLFDHHRRLRTAILRLAL